MPSDALESILVMLAALVPIVNPLGTAPIFLAMSADLPAPGRRRLAATVARNAFLLLIAAMLIGSYVLAFFGITLPVVRVAGGLVLLAAGWRLLHAGDEPDAPPTAVSDAWEREVPRRAFYPLTFPLTVGPGTISIAVTLGARGGQRPLAMDVAVDLIASAIVAVAVYLSYRFASRLIARLGETGTYVFLRLSAFILLCVAVAILWSGIVGLVEPLLHTPAPQPAATLIIHNARACRNDPRIARSRKARQPGHAEPRHHAGAALGDSRYDREPDAGRRGCRV